MKSQAPTPKIKKIVYDLGANNGDDIPYYLLKSDIVIAVEANPILCDQIHAKFRAEIEAGRVVVENCVVMDRAESCVVDFYVHKSNHVLSQLPRPAPADLMMFKKVALPAKTITEIIHSHGSPYYIKIDVEHYDTQLLRALFSSGIFPPFISAESHSIEVFALLVSQGGYNAFKLVDGRSVSRVYSNRIIVCENERREVRFSFPFHSAGPFGNDIDGGWMTADHFFKVLSLEGLGWKDIHATSLESADLSAEITSYDLILRYAHRSIKTKILGITTSMRDRLKSLSMGNRGLKN
jgi:FkbM family methyltransferase